jgi:cytosine/adenosine deaminase-related metal-dependent hydrolase
VDPHAPCDLLILGGSHVLVDESMRDISDGGLAISDGRIIAVGERAAL